MIIKLYSQNELTYNENDEDCLDKEIERLNNYDKTNCKGCIIFRTEIRTCN